MSIIEIAKKTRVSARKLAVLSAEAKNQAIEAIAKALEAAAPDIVATNAADCKAAQADGIAKPLYDRLKLKSAQACATLGYRKSPGKIQARNRRRLGMYPRLLLKLGLSDRSCADG